MSSSYSSSYKRRAPSAAMKRKRSASPYRRRLAPKRRNLCGKGSYYIRGAAYAKGNIPMYGKFGGGVDAGYYGGSGGMRGLERAPVMMKGLGAYSVSNIKHNVLIKPDIPQVRNALYAEGGTIVRHREYLGAITTSATAGNFKIQVYPLNPAQDATFPWLSTIAQNYEEYKPSGLAFEFRSTASDAIASSTNLALGQVMMCTQYDPTDPNFLTDVELLNYSWAQSGKVSDNVVHYVECDPKQSPLSHLYTRAGGTSNSSDLRFSDFGTFSIATAGLQGTSVQIGQLWVTYEFILYKPKIGNEGAESGGWFHYYNYEGSVTNTQPAGTIANGHYDAENDIGCVVADNVNGAEVQFPVQNKPSSFMVSVSWYGDSTASVTAPTVTGDTNIHFIDRYRDNVYNTLTYPGATATSTKTGFQTWVTLDADEEVHYVNFEVVTMPANAGVDIWVTEIPYLDPSL